MGKEIEIYLLRHAPTTDNERGINGSQTDTPLSENGNNIAKEIVSKISENKYDLIITSPLKRTLQTIQPYLDSLKEKISLKVEPLIIERSLGKLTNTVRGDGKIKAHRDASGKSKIEWTPPEGESILDVYERAKKFFEKIKKEHAGKIILMCSHQVFLRCFELILLGKSVFDFDEESLPSFKNGEIRFYRI